MRATRSASGSRETREETEHRGRETLENALKQHNLPYKKLAGSPLLAQIIRETGFKKAEDFYLALGSGKLQVSQVVNKVLHRLKTDEVVEEEPLPQRPKAREAVASQNFGIHVAGVDQVLVRLAKCCTPVPGDGIVGYISLGKGITIHREDCPNVKALMRNPERFTAVAWDGGASQSFRVHIAVVSWDRPRLLEDVGQDVRRARRQHRRVRRARPGSDGEELVRRGGGGHEGSPRASDLASQRRRRLRRVPRHAVLAGRTPSNEGRGTPNGGSVPVRRARARHAARVPGNEAVR